MHCSVSVYSVLRREKEGAPSFSRLRTEYTETAVSCGLNFDSGLLITLGLGQDNADAGFQ